MNIEYNSVKKELIKMKNVCPLCKNKDTVKIVRDFDRKYGITYNIPPIIVMACYNEQNEYGDPYVFPYSEPSHQEIAEYMQYLQNNNI